MFKVQSHVASMMPGQPKCKLQGDDYMNDDGPDLVRPDVRFYDEGRSKFPPEDLLKYAGERVAWSLDGTRIVAHGPSTEAVEEELAAMGIHPSQVVWETISSLDEYCQLPSLQGHDPL